MRSEQSERPTQGALAARKTLPVHRKQLEKDVTDCKKCCLSDRPLKQLLIWKKDIEKAQILSVYNASKQPVGWEESLFFFFN